MRLGYLHFPRFPVQRRVRETPSLTGRPLVLWADERGVVGSERFTVQALARHCADAAQVVEAHGGRRFSSLPLHCLTRALGPGGVEPLAGLGLSTLGEVAALPPGAVAARFGHEGSA